MKGVQKCILLILAISMASCTTSRPPLELRPEYPEVQTLENEKMSVSLKSCSVGCLDYQMFRNGVSAPFRHKLYAVHLEVTNRSKNSLLLEQSDINMLYCDAETPPADLSEVGDVLRGFWSRYLDVNKATDTMNPNAFGSALWATARILLTPLTAPGAYIDMRSDNNDLTNSIFPFGEIHRSSSVSGLVYFISDASLLECPLEVKLVFRQDDRSPAEFTFEVPSW